MKKHRFIFVFLFLAGMIFTVFQYIPILEEELAAHSHVTQKKSDPKEPSDDNGADQDDDQNDDNESDLDHCVLQGSMLLVISKQSYIRPYFLYTSLKNSITTPPPKI